MSRRRRHRKRWSIQDFDNYITQQIGDGYLELKRLLLRAPHLVKVLRGRGRWIHPKTMEPGESIVGFYPASAKPRTDEGLYEPYRKMTAEAEAQRLAEEEKIRNTAVEPEPVPPPRRPPARRPWRSFERRISQSRAA